MQDRNGTKHRGEPFNKTQEAGKTFVVMDRKTRLLGWKNSPKMTQRIKTISKKNFMHKLFGQF